MPQKFLKLGIAAVILKTFPSKVNASIISAPLAGDIEYVEPISVQIAGGVQYINKFRNCGFRCFGFKSN